MFPNGNTKADADLHKKALQHVQNLRPHWYVYAISELKDPLPHITYFELNQVGSQTDSLLQNVQESEGNHRFQS